MGTTTFAYYALYTTLPGTPTSGAPFVKTMLSITGSLLLTSVLLVGGCAAQAWQRDRAAKRFCESLIPHIEHEQKQTGHFPQQADPRWWSGQSVPSLIHVKRFYINNGSSFGFWFQNDSWIIGIVDNVWEFDSADGRWFSYDANPQSN